MYARFSRLSIPNRMRTAERKMQNISTAMRSVFMAKINLLLPIASMANREVKVNISP